MAAGHARTVEGGPLLRLAFDGLAAKVDVPDDPAFAAALAAAAADWPFRRIAPEGPPLAAVTRVADGHYALQRGGERTEGMSSVSAVCSLVVGLANTLVAETPGRLCLHGAAVAVAGRLVIFPGRRRAGKSTLVARLAMDGHVVFGDDIVPLDAHGRALALGVAPRLRLPLPRGTGAAFRRFVAEHIAASDGYYAYLALPPGGLARRGTSARPDAIVLLDRRPGARAALAPAPRSLALKLLARQNIAYNDDARPLLAAMREAVERPPAYVLSYSDLDAAAALLTEAFARWPEPPALAAPLQQQHGGDMEALTARLVDRPPPDRPAGTAWRPGDRLVRREGVETRLVDGELFLAGAGETATLCHLGPVGAAIWDLLAEPQTQGEVAALLAIAFPDVEARRIRRDVSRLFRQLAASGYAVTSASGGPRQTPAADPTR